MLPPRRLLNLLYHWTVRHMDADQRKDFDAALADAAADHATPAPTTAGNGQRPAPRHVPGLSRHDIRPPSWWKGDRAAWRSSVKAAEQLGEPAARLAGPPRIGTG